MKTCSCVISLLLSHAASAQEATCSPTVDGLSVEFDPSTLDFATDLFYVQLASPEDPDKPFALVTTLSFPTLVGGLGAGLTSSVSVRAHNASAPSIAWGPSWGAPSQAALCSTLPEGSKQASATSAFIVAKAESARSASMFMRAYRISEYAFDVDFLENHDGASVEAMPLYLMTCTTEGMCAPWSVTDLSSRFDECQAALADLCPALRGAAFACVDCAASLRANVTAACGEFSTQDTLDGEGSYAVHWHCGVGWPESTAAEGPITEYCVEYLPVTADDDAGLVSVGVPK